MDSGKYTIIEKEIKGIEISSLVIENSESNRKNVSLVDTIKLARGDKITNAKAIFDTSKGRYILAVDNGFKSLGNTDRTKGLKFSILGRMINSENKCVGYKVQDAKGKIYKLSISKIWDLAEQGSINGIKAKIISGKKILLSTDDCQLHNIPVIRNQ